MQVTGDGRGQPLFSIGVTTYDRVDMLKETLDSICAQTFTDFEVIVANDNPSRSVSGAFLGVTDPRIRYLNNRRNLGELGNMNFLLSQSRGRYFTWIADDDLYSPYYLANIHSALVKYSYPRCVYTSFSLMSSISPKPASVEYSLASIYEGPEFLRLYCKNSVKTIGVMGAFETDYLRGIGGLEDVSLDGKGMFCEYMLIVRSSMEKRIAYIDSPLVLYRDHPGAWGLTNVNAEQYLRATESLLTNTLEIIQRPEYASDRFGNSFFFVKLTMQNYMAVLKRAGRFSLQNVSAFFTAVHGCLAASYGRASVKAYLVLALIAGRFILGLFAGAVRSFVR